MENVQNSKKDKTEETKLTNTDIPSIPLETLPDNSYTIDINTNGTQTESSLTNETQTNHEKSFILLPGGGFRDPLAACTNTPVNKAETINVCYTNGAKTEPDQRDNKQTGLSHTNGDTTYIEYDDPFHIDESAMEAEKYIIYRQTSQSAIYNMERDFTKEELKAVGEAMEEATARGELFTIREETSYDDLDAIFQKIYERDSEDDHSMENTKEVNDIEEMKPVYSKPFIPSRPITPRTPLISTAGNILTTMEETENVMKTQSDIEEVEEVGEIIPFFSKPFSPDAVKKWNVMISKKQSFPARYDQESSNSRHL